jgi:hypothetical protein
MPRTTKAPPKAPTGQKSTKAKPTGARQTASSGRQRAPSTTATATAKPNKFDAIASASAKGDDDLAKQLTASLSDAKAKGSKPTADAKTDAKPKGPPKSAYAGRPVSDPAKVAARVKELKLRPRANVDVADLAQQLRATVPAVQQWLASRNGQQPAAPAPDAKPKVKAKPTAKESPDDIVASLHVQHEWVDKQPPWLKGRTLVMRYMLLRSGAVQSQLRRVLEPDGTTVPNFKDLPLDYRVQPEMSADGRRPVVLKGDLGPEALKVWLTRQGLTTPS